jgi:hypothetical protein
LKSKKLRFRSRFRGGFKELDFKGKHNREKYKVITERDA